MKAMLNLAHTQADVSDLPQDRLRFEVLQSKLLIVEDDPTNRAVLVAMYKAEGFLNISESEDGLEAIEKIKESNLPDMVVADIRMPRMDGFELCRRIRHHHDPAVARMPILVQTALKQMKDKADVYAAGATDYLTKPVDQEELISRTVLHLERQIIMRRLNNLKNQLIGESNPEVAVRAESLGGEYWQPRQLSKTMNVLLDEVERRQAEVYEAKQRAEHSEKVKSNCMSNVAQELGQPVAEISMLAEAGMQHLNSGKLPQVREGLRQTLSKLRRLEVLIGDLYAFSHSMIKS